MSTDMTPPDEIIRDANGRIIPNGGFGSGSNFTAEVDDSSSGVNGLVVTTGTVINREMDLVSGAGSFLFDDPNFYGASSTYTVNIGTLDDGSVVFFEGIDAAGNVTISSFTVDNSSPTISAVDGYGVPLVQPGLTTSSTVVVTANDSISGVASIVLFDGVNYTTNTFSGAPSTATWTLSSLSPGNYSVYAYDLAGNQGQFYFTVAKTPSVVGSTGPPVLLNVFSVPGGGLNPTAIVSAPNGDVYLAGTSMDFSAGFAMQVAPGEVVWAQTAPGVSAYNGITSVAVDSAGNAYAVLDGEDYLYKFPGGGGAPISVPLPFDVDESSGRYGTNAYVAVDTTAALVYAAFRYLDTTDPADVISNIKFAVFDESLNLQDTAYHEGEDSGDGASPLGLAVDGAGTLWTVGYDYANPGSYMLVDQCGSGLSGCSFYQTNAPVSEDGAVGAAVGGEAGSGADAIESGVALTRWSSAYGFSSPVALSSSPIGLAAGYGQADVQMSNNQIVELSTSGDMGWNPPISNAPQFVAAGVPGANQLDMVSVDGSGNIYVSIYGSQGISYTATSSDGKATVVSPISTTAIAPVSTATESGAMAAAAAQSLTLASSLYQITPSPETLPSPATLTITTSLGGADSSALALWRYNGTSWQSFPITGQSTTDNGDGTYSLSGYLGAFSLYAVFSQPTDVLPPRTTLVVGTPSYSTGTLVDATSTTVFGLTAVDDLVTVGDGIGVGVAETWLSVDGSPYGLYQGTFTIVQEATHTVSFYSVDWANNIETTNNETVIIDLTPPSLSAQDPLGNPIADGSTTTATSIQVEAEDFGSGVGAIALVQIAGGAYSSTAAFTAEAIADAVFPSTGTAPLLSGEYALSAYDMVGNVSSMTFIVAPTILAVSPYFSGGPMQGPSDGPIIQTSLGQPFVGTLAPGTTQQIIFGSGAALSIGP